MIENKIPNSHHVVRWCRRQFIGEDGSIFGEAFRCRASEEFLSVNWLEFFSGYGRLSQIEQIRLALGKKLKLSKASKFALLNVGQMIDHVAQYEGRRLNVFHRPEPGIDESHSGVFGYGHDDQIVADLIAQTVIDVHPAEANNLR